MEQKYLEEKKDNVFSKFVNFIKRIFKNKEVVKENTTETVKEETKTNNVVSIDRTPKPVESTGVHNIFDDIKVYVEDDAELLNLQKKYENSEIDLTELTDSQIHELNELYKRQIKVLTSQLNDKKTELGMMQIRLKNTINQ